MKVSENYQRIYNIIKLIPEGRVATYGQVATMAGRPGHARQVGYALNSLPDGYDLPWHRVINTKGRVSKRADPTYEELQRNLLEAEGVEFDLRGCISLARFQWKPQVPPGEE